MFRTVAVLFVRGDVTDALSKYGGIMRYTSWPGLGKRPIIEKARKEPMAPLSSFPGSPALVGAKNSGM